MRMQPNATDAKTSIVMPVYNGMPYIPEAVKSVLAQDEQDWELVISDNGSTDSTRDYLRSLQDPRIRIHLQQANMASTFLAAPGSLNWALYSACERHVSSNSERAA